MWERIIQEGLLQTFDSLFEPQTFLRLFGIDDAADIGRKNFATIPIELTMLFFLRLFPLL